jgi:hypothetical protein
MAELIEAPVVDIRKVNSRNGAARYIAKYVAKGPRAFGTLKRYWSTPKFDEDRSREPRARDEWGSGWALWKEPLFLLLEKLATFGHVYEWIDDNSAFIFAQSRSPPQGTFYEN